MLNWYHPNPLIRLTAVVRLINGKVRSVFIDSYKDAGISSLEGNVLSVIASAPTPYTVPQIARILGNSRQAIQGAVFNLKGIGLVTAARNPHHRRSPLLNVTDAGLKVLERAAAVGGEIADPILSQLDASTVKRLTKELFILLDQLDKAISEPPDI